jgi:succinyl-diaminopimelate desuccinylase
MALDLGLAAGPLTAQLVDIESVSGGEQTLADAIEAALAPLPHLSVHRDGNALIARTSLGRPERVILAGHIDTVPIAGNIPSRFEEGMLYGCGSSDMKSGVAVQLRLAATVPAPARDVTYVFYDCEEVESARNGLLRLSRAVPDQLAGDFAVLMEPTGGVVEGGCQGTLRAEITVTEQRAHSARSWMGRNAIHDASVLGVLRDYQPRQPDVDGLTYHEGLNASACAAAWLSNVIPDECVVTVNYRFARPVAGAGPGSRRGGLRGLAGDRDGRGQRRRPGLQSPAAAAFAAAMAGPAGQAGWTDVARFDALGIRPSTTARRPELAHTPHEHVRWPRSGGARSKCAPGCASWRGSGAGRPGYLDYPAGARRGRPFRCASGRMGPPGHRDLLAGMGLLGQRGQLGRRGDRWLPPR